MTDLIPARVAVITVSDTRTFDTDKSGALIEQKLEAVGHRVVARRIVADDVKEIQKLVKALVAGNTTDVVILTGGTGFAARDVTPEAVTPLFTKFIPGFGELFRMLSYQDIGSATIQSRAVAGLAGRTLIFCLPGSTNACQLAMDKIILEQIDNRHKPCNFREILGLPEPTKF